MPDDPPATDDGPLPGPHPVARRVALVAAALIATAGMLLLIVSLVGVAGQEDPDAIEQTSDVDFVVTLDAGESRIVYLGADAVGSAFDYSTAAIGCTVDAPGAPAVVTARDETRYVTTEGPSQAVVQITAVDPGEHRISCPDRNGQPVPLVLAAPGASAGSSLDPVVATLVALGAAVVAAIITVITVLVTRRPATAADVAPGSDR